MVFIGDYDGHYHTVHICHHHIIHDDEHSLEINEIAVWSLVMDISVTNDDRGG